VFLNQSLDIVLGYVGVLFLPHGPLYPRNLHVVSVLESIRKNINSPMGIVQCIVEVVGISWKSSFQIGLEAEVYWMVETLQVASLSVLLRG
jgi:hypothetical protein